MKVKSEFHNLYSALLATSMLLFFGLISQTTFAGVEPELKQFINGYDLAAGDSTLVLNDPKSFDAAGNYLSSYSSAGYKEYRIVNTLYLELNEYLSDCFIDTFTLGVKVALEYKELDQTIHYDTLFLQINYDTSLLNKNAEISTFVYENALWSKAKVLEVSNASFIDYFKLGLTFNTERYRNLDFNGVLVFNTCQLINSTGEAKFSWGSIDGAEEYDFEWTWIDAVNSSGGLFDPGAVEISFRNNATRVTIADKYYNIPTTYERGYLVARVRPVGRNKNLPKQVTYGLWSNDSYTEVLSSFAADKDYITILPTSGTFTTFNDEMNWLTGITFAENGKRKVVVSYYDGTLRNRQYITSISSDSVALASETIYDYEGRPAVNVLPAPVFLNGIKYNKYDFIPNLNISKTSNKTYSKKDFDNSPVVACSANVSPLKNTSGTSLYFSPNNPYTANRSHGYIPDAEEYPLTVTEYLADGSNRIKRQSGIGKTHQLDSNHETKIYYGTPEIQELDRLFGNGVGFKDHYTKEMVVDPNGQASVTYKDLNDLVIATSLAGSNPDIMTALPTEANAKKTLISKLKSAYHLANNEIVIEKEFLVSDNNSKYEISYDLNVPRLSFDSIPSMCFDCVYDLKISLLDECGEELLDGDTNTAGNQPIIRVIGKYGEDFDTMCESGGISYSFGQDSTLIVDADTNPSIVMYLDRGKYSLSKSLVISKKAYEYYEKKYLSASVLKTEDDFINELLLKEDTASCYQTCTECTQNLGTLSAYLSTHLNSLIADGLDSLTGVETLTEQYNTLYESCLSLCATEENVCASIYNTCLMDVMPMGQYAHYEIDANGELIPEGLLSESLNVNLGFNYKQYYNGSSWVDIDYLDANNQLILIEIDGVSLKPGQLSPSQYVRYYKKEWANSIVKFHPEYCRYEDCISDSISHSYSQAMTEVTSFNEAYRLGYLDPLDREVGIPHSVDPKFSNSTLNDAFYNSYVKEYADFPSGSTFSGCKLSILELALYTHYSDHSQSNCTELQNWLSSMTIDTTILCDSRADAVWEMFRGIYLSQKNNYLDANYCYPTIPSGFERRFIKQSEVSSKVDINTGNTEAELITNTSNKIDASCDSVCSGYASYWLYKLGGCSLDSALQDSLINTFINICKDGCDSDHPLGSRNSGSGTFTSFEEAFNAIVPSNLQGTSCDPWLIALPPSAKSSLAKLSGKKDSCLYSSSDTCFANANAHTKAYINSKMMMDSDACTDCIGCSDLLLALDSLSSYYKTSVPEFGTSWESSQKVTNFLNAYFGFNLSYFDYKEQFDTCTGCDSTTTDSTAISALVYANLQSLSNKGDLQRNYRYIQADQCFDVTQHTPTSADQTTFTNFHNSRYFNTSRHITLAQISSPFSSSLSWYTYIDTTYHLMHEDPFSCLNDANKVSAQVKYDTSQFTVYGETYIDTLGWWCIADYYDGISTCKRNFSLSLFRKINGSYTDVSYPNPSNGSITVDLISPLDTLFIYDSINSKYVAIPDDSLLVPSHYELNRNLTSSLMSWTNQGKTLVTTSQTDSLRYRISLGCLSYDVYYDEQYHVKDIIELLSSIPDGVDKAKNYSQAEVRMFDNSIDTISITIKWNTTECNESGQLVCVGSKNSTICNRAYGLSLDTVPNRCVLMKKKRASLFGRMAYRNYRDSLKEDFKQKYYATCGVAEDSIGIRYELKEYHYTLYYYDQAGNLIQTVPPKGVDIISDQSVLTQIEDARNGIGTKIYPSHSLATSYRYNTLNEVRWQNTPDADSSQFWYDRLGRIVVSQNAEQADQIIPNYSYTEYDSLGRIIEVGQINAAVSMTQAKAFDTAQLTAWLQSNTKSEITKTWYDKVPFAIGGSTFNQSNLRSRVVLMAYYQNLDSSYKQAVHYSYDIHGNVNALLREISDLHSINQGYKRIDYQYDLVSGNVNTVQYQKNQDDQFHHKYNYDADNRLVQVATSSDNIHWDRDAAYFYYLHGPLRRMTLGNLNVQGLDFAYTLHGWLKGVNGNSLNASRDIGQDGHSGSSNELVARDVFGYSLHYYDEDFTSINGWKTSQASDYFLMAETSSSGFNNKVSQLYNGNISRMVTALSKLNNQIIGKAYEYDQLNRISKAHTFNNYNLTSNTWNSGSSIGDFYSSYSYDANGNLLSLKRNAENNTVMDSLTYHYKTGTNQLTHVNDMIASNTFDYDLDDQQSNNYTYDKIGNLISDIAEEIEEITWTVYGKIQSITRTSGSKKPDLSFEYTPDGHRVAKHVTDSNDRTTSTWYIRDASGNILSTYSRTWVEAGSNASITYMDVYDQLTADQTYQSRITLLDQQINWHANIPSATLDSIEDEVVLSHLYTVLDNFSCVPHLTPPQIDVLYNTISPWDVIQMLQVNGYQDEDIYDWQCQNNFANLLTAHISNNFFQFLDNLQMLDPVVYDQMCNDLTVPPGTPPAVIVSTFTVLDVVNALIAGGGSVNCNTFQTVYDQTIGFNNPTSWGVLSNVLNFTTIIYNQFPQQDLAHMMETFLGNTGMWQKYFTNYPGTEATIISNIRSNETQLFVYYAYLAINNETTLRKSVGQLSGQNTDSWLDAVENHYGTTYLQQLCQNIGYSLDPIWQYSLQENHIYGSSRVGIQNRNLVIAQQVVNSTNVTYYSYQNDSIKIFYRGQKRYELSNHLGNVLAVITDRRIQSCGAGEVMYYEAQVVSLSDYYPFGMKIQGRSMANSEYRFGFNGKEGDEEGLGGGSSTYNYGFRIYNPSIARFLSVDPLANSFPWYSPYHFAGNRPIWCIDLEGLEEAIASRKAAALQLVLDFENDEDIKGDDYKAIRYINKNEMVRYLKARLNDPAMRSHFNSCGPTSVSYVALTHDPEQFVTVMIELWKTGKANKGSIVVPKNLKDDTKHYRNNDEIDQLLEGSLRYSENKWGGYLVKKPPSTGSDWKDKLRLARTNATLVSEIDDMLDRMGVSVDVAGPVDVKFKNVKVYEQVTKKADKRIIMFGYYDLMMGKSSTETNDFGGDHFVTVSSITLNEAKDGKEATVTVEFWHHGEYSNNGNEKRTYTKEQFEKAFNVSRTITNTGNTE